ncbi:hypothetical protein FB009_101122 [Sinorhizobium medicae]|nr:hypothetical protein FB009_101122 [Sinorhizobium medicae]
MEGAASHPIRPEGAFYRHALASFRGVSSAAVQALCAYRLYRAFRRFQLANFRQWNLTRVFPDQLARICLIGRNFKENPTVERLIHAALSEVERTGFDRRSAAQASRSLT